MKEFDKMISGQLYDARDPELTKMRAKARRLLTQINRSLNNVRNARRLELCRQLFGVLGKGFWLQPPFFCDYGCNIRLGENVFINFNCTFLDVAVIMIGDAVQIGPNVQIYTATHPLDWQQRRKGQEFAKPVTIGCDVWIGGGAILCPGVTVGEKSVVGAGAVVTKDVPAGTVVAGNPARILRSL